jgi:two-component system NtrC family sensor kinase
VVEAAVRLTAHQLQLNGVKVQTTYAAEVPKVRGNGNQLRQVLLNLMMNASQAMEGQDAKRLYVETKGGDAGAQVSVRDVGPGIAPEAQARLFEPFFTTKPRGKGTGLGLSVSRSIIEAHRGEIRVESELGKGATFYIRLPAASALADTSGPFRMNSDLTQTRH